MSASRSWEGLYKRDGSRRRPELGRTDRPWGQSRRRRGGCCISNSDGGASRSPAPGRARPWPSWSSTTGWSAGTSGAATPTSSTPFPIPARTWSASGAAPRSWASTPDGSPAGWRARVAFGIRFRPAGLRPFLGVPVSTLTDRRVAVADVFGPDGDRLVARLLAGGGHERLAATAEAFLLDRLPDPDPNVARVNRVVDQIMADPSITRVRDLADRAGIATRRLQRLFATYVGVTPKWVIRRSRLHEAVERLDEGHDVDLAFLARDLGYFDQAHFARDFRATVGRPPAAYARTAS